MAELFYRQKELTELKAMLVVPQMSDYPTQFSFHYVAECDIEGVIEKGVVDNGICKFSIKDGVLGLFHTLYIGSSDYIRAFSSDKFIDIAAAIRIGEKLPIVFESEFKKVLGISKSMFPVKEYSKSYYGKLRYYVDESYINNSGFHVISSYEEPFDDTNKTNKRLFMGFRVYGMSTNNSPVWRNTLSIAMQYFQNAEWHLSLLHTAIATESFLDITFGDLLGDIDDGLKEHIIRVSEKKVKLHTINEKYLNEHFSKSNVNKTYNELNELIFKIRNKVAHGKVHYSEVTKDEAFQAILKSIDFIWDYGIDSRKNLVTFYPMNSVEFMIDDEFVEACEIDCNRNNAT